MPAPWRALPEKHGFTILVCGTIQAAIPPVSTQTVPGGEPTGRGFGRGAGPCGSSCISRWWRRCGRWGSRRAWCRCGPTRIGRLSARCESQVASSVAALRRDRLEQRHQRAAVPLEPACEFELEQNHAHDGGRASRQSHQIVDRHRGRSEQGDDARALGGACRDRASRRSCQCMASRSQLPSVWGAGARIIEVAPMPSPRRGGGQWQGERRLEIGPYGSYALW